MTKHARLLLGCCAAFKQQVFCCCLIYLVIPVVTFCQTNAPVSTGIVLSIPGLPSNPADIVWDRLPLLKGERIKLFEGEENKTAFNHHPTVFFYKNTFFAAWSNGAIAEDSSGQHVLYSTSPDGYAWSKPVGLTPIIAERRSEPAGFCIRDGKLFAFAGVRNSRGSKLPTDDVFTLAYEWDENKAAFQERGIIAKDFLGIDGPRQVGDGRWLMFGKPRPETSAAHRAIRFAKGGMDAMESWTIRTLPDKSVQHDIGWYELPGGSLLAVEASERVPDRRLVTMYSNDQGNSWSEPLTSNFPDGDSRLYGLKLSSGRYVLLNNPNLTRHRIPLTIAVSPDGIRFDRMANIRIEQTNKRFSGHAKAPGYQYVRAMEHDGKLWIIYSVNKEDVEITAVSLDEIERLYATDQKYNPRQPGGEIIVDNNDKGFETSPGWIRDTVTTIYDGRRMEYYGTDYACATGSDSRGWAKWTTAIPKKGKYAVYIRWGQIGFGTKSSMADIAPVEIAHANGVHKSSVDQTRYGGNWIYLGAFSMNRGAASYVKIYTSQNKRTVADAVKFVLLP